MARPIKEGLDYFPLDVDIDRDDKIALIEANHGLEGFGVVIKILMKIYDNSYFYQWGEKEQLLFSKRVNVNINKVNEVINDCLKWGVFSTSLYETYQILTSAGIQRRYLEASSRRKEVKLANEYLLLGNEEVNSYKNLVVVNINPVNNDISTQRKVKESKVEESREKVEEKEPATTKDAIVFYQNNFGNIRPTISEKILDWINDFGDEMVIEAMDRALVRNKPNWGYAESILQSWHHKGIKSLEQAKSEEVEFQNQQAAKKPYYQNKSNEVVPDWFKERKQNKNTPKQEVDPEEWGETEQLLKKYSRKASGDS